jgi:hypothetical protein
MSRHWIIPVILAAAVSAAAQVGKSPNTPVFTGLPDKTEKTGNIRLLHGQVLDPTDNPVEKAVVYLKDKRTLRIITFITTRDGNYRFNGLNPNQDYEVRAEHEGVFSSTRTLSSLDGRKDVTLNLHVERKKAGAAPEAKPADSKPAEKKSDDKKKPADDKKPSEDKKPS